MAYQPQKPKSKPKSKVAIVIVVLIIIAAIIGIIIYFATQNDKSNTGPQIDSVEPEPTTIRVINADIKPPEPQIDSVEPAPTTIRVINADIKPPEPEYKLINEFYVVDGTYTIQEANDACKALGGDVATTKELIQAWGHGHQTCQDGWVSDYPFAITTAHTHVGCNASGRGITINRNVDKAAALCYGPDPNVTNQTYNSIELSGNYLMKRPFTFGEYTKEQAITFCNNIGARMANRADVETAYANKINIIYPGWIIDGDKPINALQNQDIHWGNAGINEFEATINYPAMCIFN